jgi:3-isopropylmalate/(R)-2-methylmalate dehydratase small subunit
VFEFEIENDVRHRLLNGLDDIGITLENAGAIDRFESGDAASVGPVTTSL